MFTYHQQSLWAPHIDILNADDQPMATVPREENPFHGVQYRLILLSSLVPCHNSPVILFLMCASASN
jgi:hypothetical protein